MPGRGDSVDRDAVLFVSLTPGFGGSTQSLSTVLSRMDPRVRRVVAGPSFGRFREVLLARGLMEEHVPIPAPKNPRARRLSRIVAAGRIARWARRNRNSLAAIHANGLQEVSVAAPAARLSGARLVLWIHDFEVYPWTIRLAPAVRRLLRGCDVRWTAVSSTARRMVEASGLASGEEVEIVTNPIDPASVGATHVDAGVSVGFLGVATRRKGFHLLPDVDEALSDVPLRWELFTGPARELSETWDRLRTLPEDRVVFHGKVEDVRSAYAVCDVVFVPSLKESFCRVVAEAMLNGIPVVASDIEPLRELLGDDEAGLLFPPEHVDAAAASLRRVLSDPGLRAALGARGRERAQAFLPENVVERLQTLYGAPRSLARVEEA